MKVGLPAEIQTGISRILAVELILLCIIIISVVVVTEIWLYV
jgi:hypothetical protein